MNPPAQADASNPYDVIDIPPEFAPTRVHPMRVRARQVDAGSRIPRHTHAWAQLAYASRGVLRVATTGTTWMVPPSRAIWVPPHVTHEVVIVEEAYLRTVYLDESIVPDGLDACRVVEVTGLLRELIVALDARALSSARERLLCGLVLDELSHAEPLPLAVPMPEEKRLRMLCESVLAQPAHAESLEHWASEVGASTRTISRLFKQELGVSFSQWRQQALLARAIPLLNQGRALSHVARELGYQSQSAFSAMFRRAFGESPRAFMLRGFEHRGTEDRVPAADDDEDDTDGRGALDTIG
ncbi:helix-turn-helix transcriptional regulator [Burkholderia vietnamiensis]|jgi:AraC-like DNA-binding protein|uniref:Helix-turn-helix transcriptional regulator n=1 Tax=Burkholderia vietnamiensis TaxID=60552 RepID=A0AAW7TBU1_BURVI|nr:MULTISPECIES: helix-turn-helix transcriptional regulator [Burkholderia]TPQ45716.1 AraC family transcriptional regulator [Burkholderia ubonensis]AFJ86201.1 Transcriptional regulator, AraC family [Burkholderia sp. KJ006]AOJ13750.1 AraC family transcriptional regulator [Burkholderia vietnamiensis]AOK00625.1 AraC family transcriptional regulator [Burkholderia vietnamiensis]AOK41298.1 AraC family transcriptional regulator [Burkholderia vietnamiensis]